jgi:pimeloyl-ACP methyl ester carboxylesterase
VRAKRTLVYVHGLWLSGFESARLRRELERLFACRCLVFRYPSVGASVSRNAAALKRFLTGLQSDELHIVAHSLGGIVVLKCFEQAFDLPPGRIVLLGSPVRGSRAAQRLARWRWGLRILGHSVAEELLDARERRWQGARDLGVIAGDLSIGLGKLVGGFQGQNDGTIMVEETDLPGATDRIVLHTSHFAMLFSPLVARQIAAFLRDGKFQAVH